MALTTLRAYSSWVSVDEFLLDPAGRAETDWFQIRDITGLGPVTADINTSPLGSMDGDSFVGGSVGARNIVLTIKPNPDWRAWTYEKLRRALYEYFMPKRRVRLVFETDEIAPVEILGYVESNEPNIFSKDGEIQVSIICPYPYFTSVNPIVIDGVSTYAREAGVEVDYEGSVETGINVQVSWADTGEWTPPYISIQVGDPLLTYFKVNATVDQYSYFEMSSVSGQKFVQNIAISNGVITNLLSKVQQGSHWPILQPGVNDFSVTTEHSEATELNWRLTYYNRYGGL